VPGSVGRFQKDSNFQPHISASNNHWKFTLRHVPRKEIIQTLLISVYEMKKFIHYRMNSFVDFLTSPSWVGGLLYFLFIE